jgi:hypothetical protein
MGQSSLIFNLQTASLATVLVCAVCILLPFTTASLQSEVPTFDEYSKRDVYMGVKLQCQTHPRNCPGGYVLKRARLLESLLNTDDVAPVGDEERMRAQAILDAGDYVKRSLQTMRNGLRYKLVQMLRPSYVASSEDSKEVW